MDWIRKRKITRLCKGVRFLNIFYARFKILAVLHRVRTLDKYIYAGCGYLRAIFVFLIF
jgi:hypothetical protein